MANAKKTAGKAMTRWDEELARRAQVAAKIEENVGAGAFLSTKAGVLSYKGNAVPGNKMNVVILNHVMENALYDGAYDADSPSAPICYAFGQEEASLAPHEKAEAPQNDLCKGCPHNEWGSAERGDGKACKNIRRLALITQDALEGDISKADVAFIKVPVTSVKAWAGYVKQLENTLKRPTCSVVTEISLVPDAKTQFKMQFALVEKIDGDVLGDLFTASDNALEALQQPYQANDDGGGKAKKAKPAKPAKKKKPAIRR